MTPAAEPIATVCVDVGSTWTKAVLVRADGGLAGFAEHATGADVLTGLDVAVRGVRAAGFGTAGFGAEPEVLACSSVGGGLRLAVVGDERLQATEAGHRVACSAGARVVCVHAGPLRPADVRTLRAARPDAVLLVGGADGDDPAPLLHNASRLARARIRYPIVLAGNVAAREQAAQLLDSGGCTVVTCDNVAPRLGVVEPGPARAVVAELHLRTVSSGRRTTAPSRFRRLVRSATYDAVGRATLELARLAATRVLVVDVGAGTSDVHSASSGEPARRTVEGDLGLRAAAAGVLIEGQTEGVVDPVEADLFRPTVARLVEETGFVPHDPGAAAEDRRLTAVAAVVAVRRHLRSAAEPVGFGLMVLVGGVFRQRDPDGLEAVVATLRADPVLSGPLGGAEMVVDGDSVVAPAGLLAADGRPAAADTLLRDHLLG